MLQTNSVDDLEILRQLNHDYVQSFLTSDARPYQ